VLQYVSHTIEGNQLIIRLKDISQEVYVDLQYQADVTTGILLRSAQLQNRTSSSLTIEQIASGTWHLPRGTDYRLRCLTGRWAGEWNRRPGQPMVRYRPEQLR